MRKNWWLILLLILTLLLVAVFVWWQAPTVFLEDVIPADVAYIDVFNGNSGKSFRVESSEDITHIVTNLQGIKTHKEKWSAGYDGFLFSLAFYDEEGNLIDAFIVNEEKIRDDSFFYTPDEGSLCTDYLWALEEALAQ